MWAEKVVELLDLVVLGQIAELAQKLIEVVEVLGTEEVEEMKELFKVVLKRGACQEAFELDAVVEEDLEELGLVGLESVRFVNDEDFPVD